jgi:hypothetical protein
MLADETNAWYMISDTQKRERYIAALTDAIVAMEWTPVTPETMPEHDETVLLIVEKDNVYTKEHMRRVIRGCHIENGKEEAWDDYENVTYSEEDDVYYVNAGWFEEMDFHEDYCYLDIDDGWTVTFWKPLPELPEPPKEATK